MLHSKKTVASQQHSNISMLPANQPSIQLQFLFTMTAPITPCLSPLQITRGSGERLHHLSYLVYISVGDCRSADQLVLLLEKLSQLKVESCLDALDGFFVLWPLATAFHVAYDWMQRDNRRPVRLMQK